MSEKYTYRITWSEEDNEFVGLCAEFPSLSWLSKTPDAAFKGIRKTVTEVITDMKTRNEAIPEPIATKHYSGKFIIRILPQLHRELAIEAHEAQVSLNRYINSKLSCRKLNINTPE